MNILILYKNIEDKDIIKDLKNNNVYFLNQKEYSYKKIKELKNKKDIQIIVCIGRNSFLLNIYSYFLNIPVVYTDNMKNIEDIETLLQNKLAYKIRRDLPVLMYHRVIDNKNEIGFYDTYVTKENFEKQMKYLSENNYISLTFKDIQNGEYKKKHLDMPNVDLKTIEEDLKVSNKILEEITGYTPISFAYPWGRSTKDVREIVKKEGYKFAVSTEDGPACFSDDLFEIVRVGVYSDDSIEKFALKISGKYPFIREKRNEMKAFRNKIRKFFRIKTK